jgi:hypothetical protein
MTVKRGSQLLWSFSTAMGLMLQLYSAKDVSEVRPVKTINTCSWRAFQQIDFR